MKQIYQIKDSLNKEDLEELNEILKHEEEMFEELEREYAYLLDIKAALDSDEVSQIPYYQSLTFTGLEN